MTFKVIYKKIKHNFDHERINYNSYDGAWPVFRSKSYLIEKNPSSYLVECSNLYYFVFLEKGKLIKVRIGL